MSTVMFSLANIRRCAEETAAVLERNPNPTSEVLYALAWIPDNVWRAFMVALRYPDDDRPLRREVGIL